MFDAHRGLVGQPIAALEAKRGWLLETVGEIERRLDAGDDTRHIVRSVLGGEEQPVALLSQGEYSRTNLVRIVAAHRPAR